MKKLFACIYLINACFINACFINACFISACFISACCFAQTDSPYELTRWSSAGNVVEGSEVTLSNTLCLPDNSDTVVFFSAKLFQPASDWRLLDENDQSTRGRSFNLSPGECQILTFKFKARTQGQTSVTLLLDCPGFEASCDQTYETTALVIPPENQVQGVEHRLNWQGTFTVAGATITRMYFFGEDEVRITTDSGTRRFRLSQENPDMRYLGTVAMDQVSVGHQICNLGTSLLDYDSIINTVRIRSADGEVVVSFEMEQECLRPPYSEDIRIIEGTCPLAGDQYGRAGRLEVRRNGVWRSLCADNLKQASRDAACFELGYSNADTDTDTDADENTNGNVGAISLTGCEAGNNEQNYGQFCCTSEDLYLSECALCEAGLGIVQNRTGCPGETDLGVGCQYYPQLTGCGDNGDLYRYCRITDRLTRLHVAELGSDTATIGDTLGEPLAIQGLTNNLLALFFSTELGIYILENNELRQTDSRLIGVGNDPLVYSRSNRIYLTNKENSRSIARFDIVDGNITRNVMHEIPGSTNKQDIIISPQGMMAVLSDDGRTMQILKENSSVSSLQASSLLVTVILTGLALFKTL